MTDVNGLPVVLLRGSVLFPGMMLSFDVGRKSSIEALNTAINGGLDVLVLAQKNVNKSVPGPADLFSVGTVASLKQITKLSGDRMRVFVQGICRAKVLEYVQKEPFFIAKLQRKNESEPVNQNPKTEAALRIVKDFFRRYVELSPKISPDFVNEVLACGNPAEVADLLAVNTVQDYALKQTLLADFSVLSRLQKLAHFLVKEVNILSIQEDLGAKLLEKIEIEKREHYLRAKKQLISEELGDDRSDADMVRLRQKIKKLMMSKETREELLAECDRMASMPFGAPELGVLKGYLEFCVGLPWGKRTRESSDLQRAERILNKNHFGMKKVKEKILDSLAVRALAQRPCGQILCLVGPPGVGKTSIAKSIAKAAGRKYERISLGGVRDEADIRGHRRTYIGAMPGRIISAVNKSKSKNLLLVLDEIDKLGDAEHTSPLNAMLEVLDSEQNAAFHDHYLDVPFDLSEVFFVATANTYESIPEPLLDRMEIIELPSYTHLEKAAICKQHLVPRLLKKYGLSAKDFEFSDSAIDEIISGYTREAGVRGLQRCVEDIFGKCATKILEEKTKKITISKKDVCELLGPKKFKAAQAQKKDQVGVANGLAWTKLGGDMLSVEVALMPGDGKIRLTGSMGRVMKESAHTAVSFIRSNAHKLSIDPDFYRVTDIHIHAPEGAVPKDGPSAGVALATAMISALTDTPVRHQVAMTGEITLHGRTLPVGGLREKTMAAYRAGIETVIFPKDNESSLAELDAKVRSKLHLISAENMYTVLKNSLVSTNNLEDPCGQTSGLSASAHGFVGMR